MPYNNRRYTPAATSAVAGMVNIQAEMMSFAIPQRTLFARSAAPTPMMEVLITCVALTGPPRMDALMTVIAAVTCVEKPSTGRIL